MAGGVGVAPAAGADRVPVLSDQWLGLLGARGGGLPERPGASARLQHDVADGPDGPVTYVVSFLDGRITSATLGASGDVDGTFAVAWKDAVRMALGEDDLLVGFMQGRVKYIGDVGKVLNLVPVAQSAAFAALVRTVAASPAV